MKASLTKPSLTYQHSTASRKPIKRVPGDDRHVHSADVHQMTTSSPTAVLIVPNARHANKNVARLRKSYPPSASRLPLLKRKNDNDDDDEVNKEPSLIPEKPAATKKFRSSSVNVDPNHGPDASIALENRPNSSTAEAMPTLPVRPDIYPKHAAPNETNSHSNVAPNPKVSSPTTNVPDTSPPLFISNAAGARRNADPNHNVNAPIPRPTKDVPREVSSSFPKTNVPAMKHMYLPPPYSYNAPSSSYEQSHQPSPGGWYYGWGHPAPAPPVSNVTNARATKKHHGHDADDNSSYATVDSDTSSIASDSNTPAVHSYFITQNGGIVLKDEHGRTLVLIDSDSADVATLFRNHQIQVKNLSNDNSENALLALKSLQVVPPASSKQKKFQRWTEDEDELLREAVNKSGQAPYDWKRISRKYFRGIRSSVQCKNRWTKVLCPDLKKTPFTNEEDAIILQQLELVSDQDDKPWSAIARKLPGRIAEQVSFPSFLLSCLYFIVKRLTLLF